MGGRNMTNNLQRMLLGGASLAGLATLCFTAAPAIAQTQTPPAAAEDDGPIDRVLITAERREQDAQDVAIAATVLSAEALTEQGVNSLNDIQRVSPSIAINTFNRSTFVNIRGVGIAQSAPTSSPGVAYYIDGALVPHEQFIGQSFFDIGSVEVLRGPQGTLTGQNSTGGALYVRSPGPEFEVYKGYIEQTVGDYNWLKTQAAVNIPLGGIAALRAAIVSDSRDSFTTNIGASQSQPGDQDMVSARLNLEVRPDDAWTFNLRYENFNLETDNNAVKRRNDTVSADPFVIQEDARSFMNQSGYRLSGEARWDMNDWLAVRYLISKQWGTTKDQTDGDRTTTALPRPLPPAPNNTNTGRVSFARTEFDTMIHEVNLLSTDDGPLQWVVGAFYLDEDVPVDLLRDNTHTTEFVTTVRGSEIRTLAVNTSKSVFGQASYAFSPQWEAVAGLRYSEDEQVYTRFASAGGVGTTSAQSDEVTGRLALNFRPVDDILLYGSASKGYKAGGVNLTLADPNFEPETNQVYELGAKTTLLDGALQLNGSLFQSDYQDVQLASLRAGLPTTQNAASGEATGAEIELIGVIGNFEVNAGLGWLDATFAENACINNTNAPAGTDPGCSTGNRLVPAGSALPFSPELTFNAGAQFDFEFGDGMALTPRIQFSRVSDQYATPFPSAITLVPERDLWDFRLTFKPTDNLVLEGFVQNLTDEVYIASQIQNSSSADGGIIYGAPRMIGLRARIAFN
jgi:iron complex outermembrane recepter protein